MTAFPEGAAPLSADAFRSAIEGREFTTQPAEGPRWRLAHHKGGDFTVRAANFSDEGTWSIVDSAVCTEGKKLKYLCNDFQHMNGDLFIQREGCEVMRLTRQ